jgi:soluble lytic murein transglycosylase-like protein
VRFRGLEELPTRVQVVAVVAGPRAGDRGTVVRATAEVAVGAGLPAAPGAGEYPGPFAIRQGQRMRPDVALAFDRMQHAATRAGRPLVIVSAFRSDAEQAALFRAHPDPKWVAPPGKSLHRLGTELDLGPDAAWGWLAANASHYGFTQRYSWEAWHYGFTGSPGSASVGYRAPTGAAGSGERATGAMPSFVPARYAPLISRSAQRWSVGAALLGAQLWQESKFNPNAVSPVGAAGIAQFMVGTAAMYGLSPQERFDPAKAIDAQAHLMHDLLRRFASVPLALAAYNAGEGRVAGCMCVPPIPETQGYVQSILALLGGAGLAAPAGLEIRLVA